MSGWKTARLLAYGFLMGTAGVAILGSDDAKTAYTHVTAAVKRGADSVMKTVTNIKENCEDINASANDINEVRAKKKEEKEIANAKAVLAKAEEAATEGEG